MKTQLTIKKLRKDKGINQITFAKELGISQTWLSLIESGKRKPEMKLLQRIADYFGIPIEVILWLSITGDHLSDEKKKMFDAIKPTMDSIIQETFLK
jgi:transcriptional regulator with XRE-family HTH domain